MSNFNVSSAPVVKKPDAKSIDIIQACFLDTDLANNLFARWSKTYITSQLDDLKITRVQHTDELVHPLWVKQSTIGLALSRDNEKWNVDAAEHLSSALRQFFFSIRNSTVEPFSNDGLVFLGALRTDVKLLTFEYAKFTWKQTYTVGHSEEEARRRARGATSS